MNTLGFLFHHAHIAHFNFYDILLLMTLFQCLSFALIFFIHRDNSRNHLLFTLFMLSIGLGQLNFFITYNIPAHRVIVTHLSIHVLSYSTLVFYFQGVLLYEYIRSLTSTKRQPPRNFIFVALICLILCVIQPIEFFPSLASIFWRDYVFIGTIGFVISLVFCGLSIYHLIHYEKRLLQEVSSIELVNFLWLKKITIGFLVIWVFEVLSPMFYQHVPWLAQQITTHTKNIATFGLVSFIIFSNLLHGHKIISIKPNEAPLRDPLHSHKEVELIYSSMKNHEYYKKNNLNIETFSGYISLSTRDVSHIINHHYKQNFYEFVNRFRLDEVKRLLALPEREKDSIQSIYEEAGFRSKSSFNTLFKQHTGMTPSEYRRNINS